MEKLYFYLVFENCMKYILIIFNSILQLLPDTVISLYPPPNFLRFCSKMKKKLHKQSSLFYCCEETP